MDKQACTFLLVAILILMIVYYTSSRVAEAFEVKRYNTGSKLSSALTPVIWSGDGGSFYVASGITPPLKFLSITREYGVKKLLHGSEVYADKIQFKQNPHRPDKWEIEVYDPTQLAPYIVILPPIDTSGGSATQLATEAFETKPQYDFDVEQRPTYTEYDFMRPQGSRPEDTWDQVWPYHGRITDSPAFKQNGNGNGSMKPRKGPVLPAELQVVKKGEGLPVSFNITQLPDGKIGIYLEDPYELLLYPLIVTDMGRIYVDYNSPGPYGATPLTLFKSTNLNGMITFGQEYKGKLLVNATPNLEPGSIIGIEGQPSLKFRVVCDTKVVGAYLEEFGAYEKQMVKIYPDTIRPVDKVKFIDNDATVGKGAISNMGSTVGGGDTFGRAEITDMFETFDTHRGEARNPTVAMPGEMCEVSHMYVLDIIDPRNNIVVNLDGTTILANGQMGPRVGAPLRPIDLTDKSWWREGDA